MKIEIRSHYWPNTPNLREIKIFIDGELISSYFLNQGEIFDLAMQLRHLDQDLSDIAHDIED